MGDNKRTSSFYADADRILVAVDCVIFGFDLKEEKLKVLLFKRLVKPFSGEWSLIGSFVRKNEGLDDAAKRVLLELTGIENVFLEQYRSYGEVRRDPGARVISTTYWSLIKIQTSVLSQVVGREAKWFSLEEVPELVLDHGVMLQDVMQLLERNARYRPLGFELLPSKFTMPQLFKLYQEIYRRPLDDRNFRKKILSTGLLVKLVEKDKASSRKGAFFYQFDHQKYQELLEAGFDFKL